MKKIGIYIALTGCLLGTFFTHTYAQRPRFHPQVHELGIQLFSSTYLPDLRTASDGKPVFHSYFPNGIRYKYHINVQNAIRSSLIYRKGDVGLLEAAQGSFSDYMANRQDMSLRVGFERKYHKRQLQLFAFVDGVVGIGKLDETGTLKNGTAHSLQENYMSYGLAIGGGLRYFLQKHLSVGIEAEYYYLSTSLKSSPPSDSPVPPFKLFAGKENGFNVLSAYISFHLVRMRKSCTCGKPGS